MLLGVKEVITHAAKRVSCHGHCALRQTLTNWREVVKSPSPEPLGQNGSSCTWGNNSWRVSALFSQVRKNLDSLREARGQQQG